jgi:hypothetical protein
MHMLIRVYYISPIKEGLSIRFGLLNVNPRFRTFGYIEERIALGQGRALLAQNHQKGQCVEQVNTVLFGANCSIGRDDEGLIGGG